MVIITKSLWKHQQLSSSLQLTSSDWWSLFAMPLFLYWYGVEWLVKYCYYRDTDKAYKNGALEREAYANQNDMTYLSHRRPFAWVIYIVN